MLYRAFSLFIVGGSPHMVLEHFLGLVGWNFWKKKFRSASWHYEPYSCSSSCSGIIHSDQGINLILLTMGSTWT